jgi:hypothetical protein
MSNIDFRKESTLSEEKLPSMPNSMLSPTNLQSKMALRVNDYW